ncbi:MAG: PQQ-binding-like beta-propeller repeat protein [Candidatus Brocadiia bacterium]
MFPRRPWRDASATAALLTLLALPLWAGDWPTFRHDIARSGITPEALRPPLATRWVHRPRHGPEPAWGPPKAEPVEGYLELPRVHFDTAFQVAVADGRLFFGSSSDNKLYALDAATGRVLWTAFTGGPIRLAPTAWNGRVLVGSDDGCVYCYQAADGALVWKQRAALGRRQVLGNGKMISLWPVRTGVLVDQGTAYFAAGLWPAEGVVYQAVRAADGQVVWTNDAVAEEARSSISPQGYLLASEDILFSPMGRVSPAALNRKDGALRYFAYLGKQFGGTYAVLADGKLYTGTNEMMAHAQATPHERFAWLPGRRAVVTPEVCYFATGREVAGYDRETYPAASLERRSLLGQRSNTAREIRNLRRDHQRRQADAESTRKALAELDKKLAPGPQEVPDDAATAALRKQRDELHDTLQRQTQQLEEAAKRLAAAQARLGEIDEGLKKVQQTLRSACRWSVACECAHELILAGGTLVAGGDRKVVAIDTEDGKTLWTGQVDGRAEGLAVAGGRLFVSTSTGKIYCFAGPGRPEAAPGKDQGPGKAPSDPDGDGLAAVCEAAAETVVQTTGVQRGYALVLGCGTGRLALELARRTELRVYGVEPDGAKVEAARRMLDEAGVYGTRVSIEQASPDDVPYADYFANLVVSEAALAGGLPPGGAAEMFRMLKPCGGVALIGRPAGAEAPTRSELRRWLRAGGVRDYELLADGGLWAKVERGALPGAGKWTHQYADAGNSACGDEQAVRCPLGVLWFGAPGPAKMVQRHEQAAAPLSADGRFFVQGENVVMAYDAYNGVKLWERRIQGARRTRLSRECSNFALGEEGLFLAVGDHCLRLDPATGATQATYSLPPSPDDRPRRWGCVAVVDGLLAGSAAAQPYQCDTLFVIDVSTGERRWVHRGSSIAHITIAVCGGRVFFAEAEVTPQERREALAEQLAALEKLEGKALADARRRIAQADVRRVVGLDLRTGRKHWARPVELTDCRHISRGGGELTAMAANGVLVFAAASMDGHFWREFFGGEFARRTVVVLSQRTGRELWAKPIGYRHRPLIVGDMLVAEPWAFDLRTGEVKTRPSTFRQGEEAPWQFARPGHHCGNVVACPTTLFFRSWTIAYYDLLRDSGTVHFGAQRPGCCVNVIPANGLVVAPEASAGCMCAFPLMTTVVLQPRPVRKSWAMFSVFQPGKQHRTWAMARMAESEKPSIWPIERLAINLGAPGDRRADDGTMWLGFPRPRGALVFDYPMSVRHLPGGGYYKRNPLTTEIRGTELPWVFASGCRGVSRCVLPLVREGDRPGLYRVRLGFADPDHGGPGQRLFDVRLQGRTVEEALDPCRVAGGRDAATVRQYEGIVVDGDLVIELAPVGTADGPQHTPILSSIQVERTRDMAVRIVAPRFRLSEFRLRQSREATVVNHSERRFRGRLVASAPGLLSVSPDAIDLDLEPGGRKSFHLVVSAVEGMKAGAYAVKLAVPGRGDEPEAEATALVDHLGSQRQVVLEATEDAFVRRRQAKRNFGSEQRMWVDGGSREMGDGDHGFIYLKFRLDVPGKPKSAKVRLHVGTWANAQSGDSGAIHLVEGEWEEGTLTYENRPRPGPRLAAIARIEQGQVVERAVDLSLEGRREVSLVLVPTSCDGAGYWSREGGKPAELIVEFGE